MTVEKLNVDQPGGRVALYLFLMGAPTVFISGLFVLLNINNPQDTQLGDHAWIFPTWGGIAFLTALVLRKTTFESARLFGHIWLALGVALFALVMFGTRISF